MTIPREAITKAIEGGWNPTWASLDWSKEEFVSNALVRIWHVALDPTFWQALGKALGWPFVDIDALIYWKYQAHRFYDLILTGQDTEAFWKELLTPHQSL